MNKDAFLHFAETHPELLAELRAIGLVKGGVLGDLALVAFLHPLFEHLCGRAGLPWRRPEGRYPPAAYVEVLRGIGQAPGLSGADQDKAARVVERLMQRLDETRDPARRAEWEALAEG